MDKLKVCIIGIGGMGKNHYNCYKSVNNAFVAAVCDVRTELIAERTDAGVKGYSNYKQMLEAEQPDIVDICTPSYMHEEMVLYCLNNGFNTLCEKPVTLTKEQAAKVVEAANKSGKLFMTAQVVRFMKPYMYLAEAIKSGRCGKLQRVYLNRLSAVPTWSWQDWMRDEQKSGGVVTDLMIHDLDFIQSVLGEPQSVQSYLRPLKDNSSYAQANLNYGEALVTCEASWYNAAIPFTAEYFAVFENGYVKFSAGKLTDCGKEVDLKDEYKGESAGLNISGDNAYASEIQYFADCVLSGKKPQFVTPEGAAYSVCLAEEIKKNAVIL